MEEIASHQAAETLAVCKSLLNDADSFGIPIRLLGSAAVLYRCYKIVGLQFFAHRRWKDVDFICPSDAYRKTYDFLVNLGFQSDYRLEAVTDGKRAVFYSSSLKILIDLFVDEICFSHKLDLTRRILKNSNTLSLADLLLSKLQRMNPRESDLEDVLAILGSFDTGTSDDLLINMNRIISVLSSDWGFYQTAEENLALLECFCMNFRPGEMFQLKGKAMEARSNILKELSTSRKSMRWKLRSIPGKRIKWYNEVDSTEVF